MEIFSVFLYYNRFVTYELKSPQTSQVALQAIGYPGFGRMKRLAEYFFSLPSSLDKILPRENEV